MRLAATAIVLAVLLLPATGAAGGARLQHFTIAQLREVCGSDRSAAIAFCHGFLTSVFEMATVFGGSLGGGLCPSAPIDAKSLRALAVGAMGGSSASHNRYPAAAFLLELYGKHFPCADPAE